MYVECQRCLMNSEITQYFEVDEKGLCNYCRQYDREIEMLGEDNFRREYIYRKIEEIKKSSKNKPYDCIMGLSGGRDSSYLTWWLKKQGLRVLLVHLDNGWNSELAVHNINKLCRYTGFELYTHVIDWEEFRELQKAYIKAHVIDIEALTDHAIYAIILKLSAKHNIQYIISGMNITTESIMPKDWVHNKKDAVNILDIIKKNSRIKIRSYPYISFFKNLFYHFYYKIETVMPLNYINYNIMEADRVLKQEIGWVPYSRKHGESFFTNFYQNYILPVKFKVDKRYAHLSNLICAGQMTKEEAKRKLLEPLYESADLQADIEYFLKKMDMTIDEFNLYLKQPPVPHTYYKTDKVYWDRYFSIINFYKKLF
ncbi:MAG: N-acetyl sugar amidotransferase [Candidatus Goldbacteria bacterium]|nr:N-acetyl sugar amidotransferase [Candidatus Goldiibacteriota bacterium]